MDITQIPQHKNTHDLDLASTQQPGLKYTTYGTDKTVEMSQAHISSTGSITKIKLPSAGNLDNALPEIERGHPIVAPNAYRRRDWKTFFSVIQPGDCFNLSGGLKEYLTYYQAARKRNVRLSGRKQPGGVYRVQVLEIP